MWASLVLAIFTFLSGVRQAAGRTRAGFAHTQGSDKWFQIGACSAVAADTIHAVDLRNTMMQLPAQDIPVARDVSSSHPWGIAGEDSFINGEIFARHALNAEVLFERLADLATVERRCLVNRTRGFIDVSTTNPVMPSSITSSAEPSRQAITGVPHAIASIMDRPKGSGQSIGNRRARALPRKSDFSRSPISPIYSISG